MHHSYEHTANHQHLHKVDQHHISGIANKINYSFEEEELHLEDNLNHITTSLKIA